MIGSRHLRVDDPLVREHGARITLDGVGIRFTRPPEPPLVIVSELSLSLAEATVHCIAGRSGCGKTSLLRVAAGIQPPTSGRVSWSGIDVGSLAGKELAAMRRAHMGYVDQGATVLGELTVLDNVLLPAVPTGVTEAVVSRARLLLDTFGLADRSRQPAGSLSGGERQRVAIARSLLLKPKALALDEPTANLDRVRATRVVDAIRVARDEGATVLVATHDPVMLDVADSITALD